MLRPGINLIRGVVSLAVLSPLTFLWWPVALLLASVLLALVGIAEFDRRRVKRMFARVEIERRLPPVAGRDREFLVHLIVDNKNDAAVRASLRDVHPPLAVPRLVIYDLEAPGRTRTEARSICRIGQRGLHQFGPVWLRLEGPLRLVERQQQFDCLGKIKILPETFASRDELQKEVGAEIRLLDKQRHARQHGTGTEFESLSAFRYGDDPRRIDWRATARHGDLVVRRFQIERHRDVMIIVDCGRLMGTEVGRGTKLDCAIDAALHLSRVALISGDRCGIGAFDSAVRGFLPPRSGENALRSIVETMYDLNTDWNESDFTPMLAELRSRQGKRTFIIVISDLSDPETSQRLSGSLRQLQKQHLVLFASLKTPYLAAAIREDVQTRSGVAKKAVVFRLLRDRSRALHVLRRAGVHVLDAEPQNLTVPLINRFVELRQQNLL